jgi:GNAT superfamily N-acetyltransferase
MRIACGWRVEYVPRWIEDIRAGTTFIWLIHVIADEHNKGSASDSGRRFPPHKAVGMVGIHLTHPHDPTIADFANSCRVEISMLFVYPAHGGMGIGTEAIYEMERRAASLGAEFVTINTRAYESNGDRHANLVRYERMGYTVYKEPEPIYAQWHGPGIEGLATFLEKRVSRH